MAPWSDDPKPTTTPKKPVTNALRDKVIAARDKWLTETESDLEGIVNRTLEKIFNKTILLNYLGVKEEWGGVYELDRWSSGKSPILQNLQDNAHIAADKYVDKAMGEIEFVPSEAEKKLLKSAYKRAFLDHCKEKATIRAQANAEEFISTILEDTLGVESRDVEGLPEFEY